MNGSILLGICTDQSLPYSALVERWRFYEEAGFDSVWDCDHFVRPSDPGSDYFEGGAMLAAMAAVTSRIRIGCLVASNTFRHPALLAHQAIAIDHISGGRLEFGIGAGWFVEEHERFGVDFGTPRDRVDRLEEALEIVAPLMSGEEVSFSGDHYQLQGARLRPGSVQNPRPPITMGAHQPRMLRLCARFADRWNSYGTVEEISFRNQVIDEACAELDRDPAEIIRSFYGWIPNLTSMGLPDPWSSEGAFAEVAGRYMEVGINEFIFDQPQAGQMANATKIMEMVRQGRSHDS